MAIDICCSHLGLTVGVRTAVTGCYTTGVHKKEEVRTTARENWLFA